MQSEQKKGILIGLAIYGVGTVLTVIVHWIYGWKYPHGPPPSAIPIFVTIVIGAIRLLITAYRVILKKSALAKGELIVHASAALVLILLIQWLKYYSG
ncbi:hypothetical protein SAMN04488109_2024 [Chryseolinea serpens]|jgi:hypothetical protein|uniref:Uncharacterized protein n=1 Tax=Chryseolinea serpens TaxID=947013 RepID=A0A1M5N0I3_9BACT|nr:hypothetical protein [Chryseolinea serpens]SHG82679.1 hypothetical protein SAMN04488109_2024 [Chryseolinea serpens]